MTALISLRDVTKTFFNDGFAVEVLHGVSLDIEAGEFVAIIGQSGSGKSTLMNILGCLDQPTSGEYRIDGEPVSDFETDELAALRRRTFGFVFQSYNLIPTASARENVEVPAIYAGLPARERQERADMLLSSLKLGDRLDHRPNQLSGGQQQRVSIARALMNGGRVILADEPTGALDSQSGEEVMALLRRMHEDGHTIILITHSREVAEAADRLIEIRDGRIISDRAAAPATARPIASRTRCRRSSRLASTTSHLMRRRCSSEDRSSGGSSGRVPSSTSLRTSRNTRPCSTTSCSASSCSASRARPSQARRRIASSMR